MNPNDPSVPPTEPVTATPGSSSPVQAPLAAAPSGPDDESGQRQGDAQARAGAGAVVQRGERCLKEHPDLALALAFATGAAAGLAAGTVLGRAVAHEWRQDPRVSLRLVVKRLRDELDLDRTDQPTH